jgi:hypothetical protein
MRDALELRVTAIAQQCLALLPLELIRFAIETATPAFRITTDHGGFDEQLLPAPRRSQRAGPDLLRI